MSKYRKKPVKVEAVQFDGTNESVECILQQAGCEKITKSCDILFIETPVGTKSVTIGDYIIIDTGSYIPADARIKYIQT